MLDPCDVVPSWVLFREFVVRVQVANIPTIDIIEHDMNTKSGFNKHWHTHGDDMNNIDKNTLNAVGQTVTSVIYNE